MNILIGSVELAGSFVEHYILFRIYAEILHKNRQIQSQRLDLCLSIIGTILISASNHIALLSVVTLVLFCIYVSTTGQLLYRTNFITLFSIASFYAICVGAFDFLILSFISSFFQGSQTIGMLITTLGVPRMLVIIFVKICWILFYIVIRKYLYVFSERVNYVNMVLVFSIVGFVGFIFLFKFTMEAFHVSVVGIWLVFVSVLAFFIYAAYFVTVSREEKMKLQFAEEHNRLLKENYHKINEIYSTNAKLYHDMNNHLNVLYQLLEKDDKEHAKEYISEIRKPIKELTEEIEKRCNLADRENHGVDFEV